MNNRDTAIIWPMRHDAAGDTAAATAAAAAASELSTDENG